MKVFILEYLKVDTWNGECIDDIQTESHVDIFKTKEEAQKRMEENFNGAIEEIVRTDDPEEIEQFGEDGYAEKCINETSANVSAWDSCGSGELRKWNIVEKEI